MSDAYFELVCGDEVIDPDVLRAGNSFMSPVELFRFAAHENSEVREALAARHDLPRKAFEILAADPVAAVRQALARNPATPADVLELIRPTT
jgi:hypothetical protein